MKLRLSEIKVGKNYSRMEGLGDLTELEYSLTEHGQLCPVIVSPENELLAGFRRVQAMTNLEWEWCEVTVSDKQSAVVNLIENMVREDLTLWEEVLAIKEAFPNGETPGEIARALSKSTSWVRPRVNVWNLNQEQIDKVRSGEWAVSHIVSALKDNRGPSRVSLVRGHPTIPDMKRAVSKLVQQGRIKEARALSYGVGAITWEQLIDGDDPKASP